MIVKKNIVLRKGLRLEDPLTEKNQENQRQFVGEIMRDIPLTEVLTSDINAFDIFKNGEKKQGI